MVGEHLEGLNIEDKETRIELDVGWGGTAEQLVDFEEGVAFTVA